MAARSNRTSLRGSLTASNMTPLFYQLLGRCLWIIFPSGFPSGTLAQSGTSLLRKSNAKNYFKECNGQFRCRRLFWIISCNARPSRMMVLADDKLVATINLKDTTAMQVIRLANPVKATFLRLKVLTVFPGTKWQDMAISEIFVDLEEHNLISE